MKKFSLIACLLLSFSIQAQNTWYVSTGSGSMNGTSFSNAFDNLQDALDAASSGDSIFLKKGIYYPTVRSGGTLDDRDKAFVLVNGVGIYGGFLGGEEFLYERDDSQILTSNKSVLSGDLGTPGDSSDNAYHVALAINVSTNTILDGVVISDGNADDSSTNVVNTIMTKRNYGGGIYAHNGDLTIRHCIIENNLSYSGGAGMNNESCGSGTTIHASYFESNKIHGQNPNDFGGAGMRNFQSHPEIVNVEFNHNVAHNIQGGAGIRNESSSPTLDSCIFYFNKAFNGDGGGGIYCAQNSAPEISNCHFQNNYTLNQGAGMYCDNSIPEISDTYFHWNVAEGGGGAMENDGGSHVVLNNVEFTGNETDANGGAIQNWKSSPVMNNVTFSMNVAGQDGGALYNYNDCSPKVSNTIFSNNTAGRNGGAVYNRRNCNPVLTNILVHHNEAASFGGGFYTVESNGSPCSPVVTNATVVLNSADSSGGGGFDDGGGNSKLRNSIVMYNSSVSGTDEIDAPSSLSATALFRSIIGTEYYVNGTTMPTTVTGQVFDDTVSTYYLANGSMAIDLGDSSFYNTGQSPNISSITVDLKGADRIMQSNIDLGAYEVCSDTANFSLTLTSNPTMPTSIHSTITFTANYTGGGSNPVFKWFLNGIQKTNITGPVYVGNGGQEFNTGDEVIVFMESSDPCADIGQGFSNAIIVELVGGIANAIELETVEVFPNPNNGQFYLEGDFRKGSVYTVEIFDITGKRVEYQKLAPQSPNRIFINSNLGDGLYFINLSNEVTRYEVRKIQVLRR